MSAATRWAAFSLSLLGLSACVPTATHGPQPKSLEYRISWGLYTVDAEPAFRTGASGQGVTIALIDCGVEQENSDFGRNLSPLSIDLNPDRKLPKAERHANYVAGPMESMLDGRGQVGVAYNATLLSIRADFDGGLNGQCAFRASDLARGLDYAREKGARIAVMPVEGLNPLGSAFEDALERATASGMAVVIAAGNEAKDDPSWPARYAADPRFGGAVAVAGAANPDGTLAKWSNRAGTTKAYYLLAPGVKVITDCDESYCTMVSGTSFATPYIAGALALVMEARPELTGREALGVLLHGADQRGRPRRLVGHGTLDIGRAFFYLKSWPATAKSRATEPS